MRRLRVAFVGKGGSGKSLVVGTLARLLARRGEPVLVLDSDVMPGLALSLGMEALDAPIPDEAVEENPDEGGPRFALREGLSAAAAVETYARRGPDGVRLLQLGKITGPASQIMRSQSAFREIVGDLPDGTWHVIGDLPGGTRQPFFGWGGYARTILVVVEPTAKAILSARRLARLRDTGEGPRVVAVANKTDTDGDSDEIAARTGLEVIGAIPRDEGVAAAEQRGEAPVDAVPDAPAVAAIGSLLDHLLPDRLGDVKEPA